MQPSSQRTFRDLIAANKLQGALLAVAFVLFSMVALFSLTLILIGLGSPDALGAMDASAVLAVTAGSFAVTNDLHGCRVLARGPHAAIGGWSRAHHH